MSTVVALYTDADGDGFGIDEDAPHGCPSSPPVPPSGDCDDGNADIFRVSLNFGLILSMEQTMSHVLSVPTPLQGYTYD